MKNKRIWFLLAIPVLALLLLVINRLVGHWIYGDHTYEQVLSEEVLKRTGYRPSIEDIHGGSNGPCGGPLGASVSREYRKADTGEWIYIIMRKVPYITPWKTISFSVVKERRKTWDPQ